MPVTKHAELRSAFVFDCPGCGHHNTVEALVTMVPDESWSGELATVPDSSIEFRLESILDSVNAAARDEPSVTVSGTVARAVIAPPTAVCHYCFERIGLAVASGQ